MTDAQVRILTLIEKGRHFYQSGDWLEAQRCWQEVLRVDPRHPHALFLLQQLPYSPPPLPQTSTKHSHPSPTSHKSPVTSTHPAPTSHRSTETSAHTAPPARKSPVTSTHPAPNLASASRKSPVTSTHQAPDLAQHLTSADQHNTDPDIDALFAWPTGSPSPSPLHETSASFDQMNPPPMRPSGRMDPPSFPEEDAYFDDSFLSAPPSSFVARVSHLQKQEHSHNESVSRGGSFDSPLQKQERSPASQPPSHEEDDSFLNPPPSSDYAHLLFDDLHLASPSPLASPFEGPSPRSSRDLLPALSAHLTETESSPHYTSFPQAAPPHAASAATQHPPHIELWEETPSAPRDERDMLLAAAEDLYHFEDYQGAIEMIEILQSSGKLSDTAQRLRERCERFLQEEYVGLISNASQTPRLNVSFQQLSSLELDHRAGFLLSQIDGRTNLRDLLLLSNLPEFHFLRLLHQLLQKGIITL